MMRIALAVCLGAAALAACEEGFAGPDPVPPGTLDAQLRQEFGRWNIIPIGPMPEQPAAMVALGRALFFDKILSGNRDIACATCHDASAAMGDGLSLAVGTGGAGVAAGRTLGPGMAFVPRNAPTLLNAGLGLYQLFWDGRLFGFGFQFGPGPATVDSVLLPPGLPNALTAQALLPVLNRREMRGQPGDMDVFGKANELAGFGDKEHSAIWNAVMQRVLAIPEYVALFTAAFPNRLTGFRFEHAAQAIAAFQMQAFTKTRSPFDRYLDRDDFALTTEQKRGGLLFFGKAQCSSCHNGPFLGAQGIANTGAPQIGPGGRKQTPFDLGRGETEPFEGYRFAFRVSPLRNVELTGPYFHSGAYQTLEAVVQHYNDVNFALRNYDVSQLDPQFRDQVHLDEATITAMLSTLDFRLQRPLNLTDGEVTDLVAFLKALTDPAARYLGSVAPASVPSGLPVH